MSSRKLRKLVMPTALAVSSFVMGAAACSDDEVTEVSDLPACGDVMSSECVKCQNLVGGISCAGEPEPDAECYYQESSDSCDYAVA